MTTEDIKLTVLTTMAEAAGSPAERHQLMTHVESARYNEFVRFERKKQVLLRLMLYALVGILISTSVQPLVPSLAAFLSGHHVAAPAPVADGGSLNRLFKPLNMPTWRDSQ